MNLQYKDVIVAIDGSKAAEKAFNKSITVAKNNDSRLILTNIIDSRSFATAEAYDRTLAERADEEAKKLIDRYVNLATEQGVDNIVKCIEYGSPKVKIAKEIAKTFEADLIICGATGMNAVERFLMGSVSESITRYAKCDVLVVR
ncbi:MAG TPA: universal stress protein [Virgibacillus sp.]|nr:universal stress protein [Virgibacillus sp.]